MATQNFLSCDWGTSNFRLRLVAEPSLEILAETTSDQGIAETYKAWQASGKTDEASRKAWYLGIIKEHTTKLEQSFGKPLAGTQVVISGMATSSIGIAAIPYQHLPFPIDGSGLKTQLWPADKDFDHELLLISGVQSDDDVMRGEETQLAGCITKEMEQYDGPQLLIHPGTHSKHIMIENGQVTTFSTFMTGEFFKVLTTHGILKDNVEAGEENSAASEGFKQGVKDAVDANLLHAAFKVRTNDLFGKMSKKEDFQYLSGLLIGSELQVLRHIAARVYLASGASLYRQYETALATLGLKDTVEILPAKWVDESVIRGQYKVRCHLSK